jgi:hypothetical protein
MDHLSLIREKKATQLIPEVEAAFKRKPDIVTIQALGELGGKAQLQILYAKIPDLVDLKSRKNVPFSQDQCRFQEISTRF